MMPVQQINLYQLELEETREALNADLLFKAVVLLLVVLGGVYGYRYWSYQQDSQLLDELQVTQQQAQQRLLQVQQTYQPRQKNPRLQKDIQRYESWIAAREQAVLVLSEKRFGNTEGFAGHFTGLARQTMHGLWLTGLRFSEGGSQVGLKGSALKPELVPQFLQRLSAEDVFSGTRFDSLVMSREKEEKQQVDFHLSSVEEQGGTL